MRYYQVERLLLRLINIVSYFTDKNKKALTPERVEYLAMKTAPELAVDAVRDITYFTPNPMVVMMFGDVHALVRDKHTGDDNYNPCDFCSLKKNCAYVLDNLGDGHNMCDTLMGEKGYHFEKVELRPEGPAVIETDRLLDIIEEK